METFNIEELKTAYDEILKNTWNNGKTKSDVDDTKRIFYERYKYMVFICGTMTTQAQHFVIVVKNHI